MFNTYSIHKKTEVRRILSAAVSVLMAVIAAASWMVWDTEPVSAAADLSRQTASSDTATIRMSKTLTAVQQNKFPSVTDFSFTLERIKAWANSNTTAATNGATIQKSQMPMPAASSTANHTITVSGDTATVAIGNFSAADSQDTSTVKNRYTNVPIKFTKAGYYVYKVKEASSTPESLPGLTYDTHEYFIVVYVCNKVDSNDNTVDGVYVHNITSYRNDSGSDTYQPTLSDISKVTDNNGTAAKPNTEANLGKVGISSATEPNLLMADNMWNVYNTSDLLISNNVQGTLGDRNKEFEFDVTLSGLENNKDYKLSGDVDLDSISTGTYSSQNKTFTTNAQGQATFKIKLKDDQTVRIEALNATSKYTVSESANNHIPSYSITAAGGSGATIAKAQDAYTSDNLSLSTSQETVDLADKDQTVAFQNKRNLATLTGTRSSMLAMAVLAGVIMIIIAAFSAMRRVTEDAA